MKAPESSADKPQDRNIELWGVKQNNLKNIDVKIPLGSFTVVCGPSGSGKSSLAFQTLYAEGQRRYIESLSSYARQFLGKAPKPDVEGVRNIPPAIAIEQKNTVKTSRSTVGTSTEVIDYLRLLFEKVGLPHCPSYNFRIQKESPTEATRQALEKLQGQRGYILSPILAHEDRADAQVLLHALLQDGYSRLLVPNKKAPKSAALSKSSRKSATKTTSKKVASRKSTAAEDSEPNSELEGTDGMGHSLSQLVATASVGLPMCQPEVAPPDFEIVELKPTDTPKVIPSQDFYIVVDRVAFREEDAGRIADSVQQAYAASLKYNPGLSAGQVEFRDTTGKRLVLSEDLRCQQCGFTFPTPSTALFSFNSPIGACAACNGFGNRLELDEAKIIPNPQLTLKEGALSPFSMPSAAYDRRQLFDYCKKTGIDVNVPWPRLPQLQREKIWNGDGKWYGVQGFFEYLETKKYKMHVRVFLSRFKSPLPCHTCRGSRLKPEVALFRVGGKSLDELSRLTLGELNNFISQLKLSKMETELAGEVFRQLSSRLQFLVEVGVEYLTLDRPTKTLSGGEYQRLNLAKQLGMGLSQTLYVLDEPTVGLHPRDNDRLIGILKKLNALGNTLVVVEHDHDVIQNSDRVIEMGPGSGHLGGEVVFTGDRTAFLQSDLSITAAYLGNKKPNANPRPRTTLIEDHRYALTLKGARGHNLKKIDVKFPLNRLVTVTGVSGSGKSTLVAQTLYPAIAQALRIEYLPGQAYDELEGLEHVHGVMFLDQSPIGKTARSSPVTYLKIFDGIRSVMAATPDAKLRGYTPGTFSLNVDGGRCPVCKGLGVEVIDMMFMDDVTLVCDACDGKKYRREILEVTYKNKNIHQILEMTVDEAMEFFVAHPPIRKPLSFLREVGLGYLRLGQSASTLSGGESQRLKIAREFIGAQQRHTLYILDEPTTGLHFREIELLMSVLHRLVESGGSVILIEHNLDVIRASDWIIDLGPEAGSGGGQIVAQGPPEALLKSPKSLTGEYLRRYLKGAAQL